MAQDVNIKINVDANQAEQSTTNYKKTLKDLQAQMVELQVNTNGLANATDEQRAQYAALEQQAGQLSDAISDVSARVKANADDYQYFNASLEALKGGTAVAQGLVGTLDLLGVSNSGVEKVVKTLMSLQGVMNSLNAVQQLFNKDSKIRIALEKIMTSQTKQKATAEAASATALTAEGAATTGATVATRSFTAALMSNPIFLMATVIAGVTAALITFTGVLDQNTESVDDNSESLEENTEQINNNVAARRKLFESYSGGLIQDIQDTNNTIEKQALMLEFVTTKLGVQVNSIEEAEKIYKSFEKTIGSVSMSMRYFEGEGTEVTKEFASIKDAASSLTTAQLMVDEMKRRVDNLSKTKNYGDLAEAEFNLQTWERNLMYAQNIYDIFERKLVGSYKNRLKNTKKESDETKGIIKSTADDATEKIVDFGEMQRRINDEVYKDEEKTYEGRKKHLLEEIKNSEAAFEQEKEDMKAVLGEGTDEYKTWLDLRETQLSQHLENINENIDKLDKEENRKRLDRENQVDSEILQARLNNLKEGSEEYYDVQREIEEENHEQNLEDLRRRLEDGLLTKEEKKQLELEAELKHQQSITQIQEKEDEKRMELTQQRLQAVGSMFANLTDFVTGLMELELEEAEGNEKKQKEIKKKYATAQAVMKIGQIGIDTALGIMGVWSQVMQLGPIAGPILGAVLSATIGAIGIVNTAKAIQEKNKIMKAANGAFVVGASHSEGGVMMELEGGEAVLNKRAMAIPQYRSLASAMNVATGGVAFPNSGKSVSIISKDDLRAVVSETVAAVTAIPVVVTEQSITNAQRKVGVIEGRSRF